MRVFHLAVGLLSEKDGRRHANDQYQNVVREFTLADFHVVVR